MKTSSLGVFILLMLFTLFTGIVSAEDSIDVTELTDGDTTDIYVVNQSAVEAETFVATEESIQVSEDVNLAAVSVSTNESTDTVTVTIDEYLEQDTTQTVGVPLSDMGNFSGFVLVNHYDENGINDWSKVQQPAIYEGYIYIDAEFSTVTIEPFISLVKNWNMETWLSGTTTPTNWTYSSAGGAQSTTAKLGTYSYAITGANTAVRGMITQPLVVSAGYYTIAAHVKATGVTAGKLNIDLQGGSPSVDSTGASLSENSEWVWLEFREYINSVNPNLRIFVDSTANTGSTFYIDSIVVSRDYSYTATESKDGSHLYQSFTYTPTAVNAYSEMVTNFEYYTLANYQVTGASTTIDGTAKTTYVSGENIYFDTSGLSAAAHTVNTTVTYTPVGTFPSNGVLAWKGINWNVRAGTGAPENNIWNSNGVWTDSDGHLHMTLEEYNSVWQATELISPSKYSYGSYTWTTSSDYFNLDKNAVLGMFTYYNDTEEIDIEVAKWQEVNGDNLWFTNQPSQINGVPVNANLKSFKPSHTGRPVKYRIDYTAGSIHYIVSYADDNSVIGEWTYTDTASIPKAEMYVMMNLWAYAIPSDGAAIEVEFTDFTTGAVSQGSTSELATPSFVTSVNSTGGHVFPLTVQFTDTSLGTPTSWSWDFGDNSTANTQNPSHVYATEGTYNVRLTAGNTHGSTTTYDSLAIYNHTRAPNNYSQYMSKIFQPNMTGWNFAGNIFTFYGMFVEESLLWLMLLIVPLLTLWNRQGSLIIACAIYLFIGGIMAPHLPAFFAGSQFWFLALGSGGIVYKLFISGD
jgi:endo-1,3-1,4-beta-glycanase ExoK